MTDVQLNPADLQAFLDQLSDLGIGTASYDPSTLQLLPAIWVRIDGIDVTHFLEDGNVLTDTTIHLIVSEKPIDRALAELLPMLDTLCELLTPTGLVTIVGVPLPGSTTLRPALAVPFQLRTVPTP